MLSIINRINNAATNNYFIFHHLSRDVQHELCSIIVNYTVYGIGNIYAIYRMNFNANADLKLKRTLRAFVMESALKWDLNYWNEFPTEALQAKALFSNAWISNCDRTNPDQPKIGRKRWLTKGKINSMGILKRNAFESLIHLQIVWQTESLINVDLKISFAVFDANKSWCNSEPIVEFEIQMRRKEKLMENSVERVWKLNC